jgi:hypothetical protein
MLAATFVDADAIGKRLEREDPAEAKYSALQTSSEK